MPGSPRIRVLFVDDHPVVRDGLAAILGSQPDMTPVAGAASGQEALELFRSERPDVTLMDLRLPDMSGIDVIRQLRQQNAHARVIVLTTYDTDEDVHRALEAGAQSYLLKDSPSRELLDTIRLVHAGQRRLTASVAERLAENLLRPGLTPRELRVLQLVSHGLRNKEIAHEMDITEETVKGHIKNLLSKLNATDRTQAVTVALRRGIISL